MNKDITALSSINVLAELERNGIGYEFANSEEVKIKCPFHDDNSPSCFVNTSKEVFICRATQCGKHGDLYALLARALGVTRKVVIEDLSRRYAISIEATIDAKLIERYHNRIWRAELLLAELYKRGLTEDDIRKYRLGEHGGRITIPIKNSAGHYVNIRSYLPGAPGTDKMKNLKGRASIPRLYPIEQLQFNKIVITGGEIKAIAAASILNKHGYGVVTATAGEGSWDPSLTDLIRHKDTWTMMDIDDAGRKATSIINRLIHRHVETVHDVCLPLSREVHPKGDVNDFIAEGGNLLEVIESTPVWTPVGFVDENEEPTAVTLTESGNAKYAKKRVRLTACVTSIGQTPYSIPKTLHVQCTRDQKECGLCPVYLEEETYEFKISSESPALMGMVDQKTSIQQELIKSELRIPLSCQVCSFEGLTYYNIEDVRISPQLQITERTTEKTLQPALCVSEGLELNETYEFVGKMHPHPQTQQSTLMISKCTATEDALSTYVCENPGRLALFQPLEWTVDSLRERLDDIYNDLSSNVTKVYQRQDLHLMYDLAYHSPLLLKIDGKSVKGWVEVLVVGDSSQGKSEAMLNMQQHYGLGEKIECKNATVAGLLGGLQQFNGRWHVTWGLLPQHDRRLVILEELKGAHIDVISKLTDMRSSGIAEIPKIEKRRTHARTRLIAISNPRGPKSISQYTFGMSCIPELIGSLEDVRRFDACLILSKKDVSAEIINMRPQDRAPVQHTYTADLCRELILWGWTLQDVLWEPEAELLVLDHAIKFCERYSEAIPIVDKGSMRHKIARLAASLAVRTFSTDSPEASSVLVRTCHVEYIAEYLESIYGSDTFGYVDFTNSQTMYEGLQDVHIIKGQLEATPFAADLVEHLLAAERIQIQDLQDWCDWDRGQAQSLLSVLVRKRALMRNNSYYIKTAPFIEMLKAFKPTGRPAFIKEETTFNQPEF